ncbi:sugar phosphate isomerase/epimerase [Saonia flava]|uniref:Sugar phosphate isomerase/epimerase n=1 Tax=Saonia flava TaxID=523696 RepID=A0A846R0I5_9FLAO|nr:sugar phosphate isomerase/epimerase family protein [Saonia flava]NJB71435.1 sugar phosphate isomerase/epimerase [Saonia flava]
MNERRKFVKQLGLGTMGAGLMTSLPQSLFAKTGPSFSYQISLAQFSLASEFFTGKHDTLEFPARAKNEYGVNIVEYVSMFFADKANDSFFFKELKTRTDDIGVKNHLIMVDDENIADLDKAKREHAVESHYKWVEAAKILGCSSIRVNLGSIEQTGTAEEVADAAMEGYSKLLEYGDQHEMDIIVENHVGHSCNGKWLAGIMKEVNHKRAGVLPDFGNFCVNRTKPETMDIAGYMNTKCLEQYDMYLGVEELMPYAKGISAKTHKFDADGNETEIDFGKMFNIIKKSGFNGIVGIEYEGGLMHLQGMEGYLSNEDGIHATKKLIERTVRQINKNR